jgi:tRNA(Ile)-lysidine synthase
LLALAAHEGLDPVAVYVDHGLRPDSPRDGEVVAEAAARLGARAVVRKVRVAPGGNLEERARGARYHALETARAELGATAVLVAHTADDQAETVLLNLVRGSGSRGLAGMPARRGHIARPLLGVRRSEVRACCDAFGLVPVADPTNDDPAHRRNWVRHAVLPALSDGAERDLVPVLTRQAAVLRAEADLLDELGDALLAEAGGREPTARVLAAAHPAIARRAVRRWLGTPPPSLAEVERVLAVARGECRAAQLTGARRIWRQNGVMHQEVPCRP